MKIEQLANYYYIEYNGTNECKGIISDFIKRINIKYKNKYIYEVIFLTDKEIADYSKRGYVNLEFYYKVTCVDDLDKSCSGGAGLGQCLYFDVSKKQLGTFNLQYLDKLKEEYKF